MWYRFCQTVINQAVKLPDGSVVIPQKVFSENNEQIEIALKQLTGGVGYAQLNQPPLSLNPQTNSPAPAPSATRSMPPAMPAQTNPPTSNTQQTNQKTLPQRGGNETYISTAPNNYKLNGYDVRINPNPKTGRVEVFLTGKNGTEIQSQVSWMPGTSNMQILRDMKTNFDRYLIPKPKPKEDYQFT